jgi:4-hydroxy 2-oxovalerate aldolase
MKNQSPLKFEVLDCTIRDGGYLNNWNFDIRMVKDFYRNISKTGVDIIELGFRNRPQGRDMGLWYSVSDDLVNEVMKGSSGVPVALMLDYGTEDIDSIKSADKSPVSMYRITCHKNKVIGAIELCDELKSRGYVVSIQLMGIGGYKQDELDSVEKLLKKASLDYVYFADSYGSLLPKDIGKYIKSFQPTGKKIGFHAHNSLQLAFANTLEAINSGVDIVDATVFGMGRGAGNLALETIIAYLEKTLGHKKYNVMPVLDLIDRYFSGLRDKLRWGYDLPNMLSGIMEVHPNYAKALVDYHEYNIDDMVKVLEIVKGINPIGFDKGIVEKVISSGFVGSVKGAQNTQHDVAELSLLKEKSPVKYENRHLGSDFLILANGPSLKEHKSEIDEFIKKYDPIIMGANYLGGLFKPHYHAFSNKKRFSNYIEQVDLSCRLLISSSFDESFIREYTAREYEQITHLNTISENFGIIDGVMTSNCRTVSILLIAVAIIMGAKRIFIAGMDGYKNKENFLSNSVHFYSENDEAENFKILMEKHNSNESLLNSINAYLLDNNKEGLHIITPTSHKLFYNSVYNWVK